jgi:membrane protease YdiL (CAAX protease family)
MKELVKRHPAWAFLIFIVVWTWTFMAAMIALVPIDPVEGPGLVHVLLVFLVASPSVFGILFARLIDGKDGVRALFSRVARWRVSPVWYAAALLIVPAIYGVNYFLQGLLGGSLAPIDVADKLMFAIPIALTACVMEEFGWRGFALPKLLERHRPQTAALIVGVGWALWHAPINYLAVQKFGADAIPILIALAVPPIAETVLMTWIHINAKASMLLMLLAHFAITSGAIVFGLSNPTAVAELRVDLVAAGTFVLMAAAVAVGSKRIVRVRHSRQDT